MTTFTQDPQTLENMETEAAERMGLMCRVEDPNGCDRPGPYPSQKQRGSHEYHHRNRLKKTQGDGPDLPLTKGEISKPDPDPEQPAGAATRVRQVSRAETARMAGGLHWESLSERSKLFAEVLDAAVDPSFRTEKRRQAIMAFEEESTDLSKDAHSLENFLDDYGLTMSQIRQIVRRIIGRGQRSSGPGVGGNGAQQVMAMDPRTGQSVPVIILNQQPSRESPNQPPFIINQAPREETLTKRDVVEIVDELLKRRDPAPRPAEAHGIRRYQVPLTDDDGSWVLDNDGQPVLGWVEEPAGSGTDPMDKAFKYLQQFQRMAQPKGEPVQVAPGITLEDVRRLLREEGGDRAATIPASEAKLREDLVRVETKMEGKENAEAAAQAAAERVFDHFKPELERLRDSQGSGGETELQTRHKHEIGMLREFRNGIEEITNGVRQEFQPLVKMAISAQLRGMGMQEQTIADILRTPQGNQLNSAAEERRAAAARARWEK